MPLLWPQLSSWHTTAVPVSGLHPTRAMRMTMRTMIFIVTPQWQRGESNPKPLTGLAATLAGGPPGPFGCSLPMLRTVTGSDDHLSGVVLGYAYTKHNPTMLERAIAHSSPRSRLLGGLKLVWRYPSHSGLCEAVA